MAREQVFLLLVAAAAIALLYGVGIGCPIRYVTGVPCPGCGLTRAFWAAMHLDFSKAFWYHPLFWLVPFVAVIGFSSRAKALFGKRRDLLLILSAVLFFAVYLARLIFNQVP